MFEMKITALKVLSWNNLLTPDLTTACTTLASNQHVFSCIKSQPTWEKSKWQAWKSQGKTRASPSSWNLNHKYFLWKAEVVFELFKLTGGGVFVHILQVQTRFIFLNEPAALQQNLQHQTLILFLFSWLVANLSKDTAFKHGLYCWKPK